ncbi:methionine ABC transporter ATP-binding protein [Stomatohabitans albus]|uniref:methionine ABC transporter ATP-binding protein n=1 Tax=Stomatohabitans albus TaxID=3110766 RepID=UPI00300C910F
MITLAHVSKTFPGPNPVRALDDVSLHVEAGEIYGVVGTSGAGKSTLIRTVNGLERPDSGTVTVNGRDMRALHGEALRVARHDIGMIFQQFNLLSSKTALANVELALITSGFTGDREREAMNMLDRVGLADRAHQYPAQLSGGQKQRVGIARALASKPSVLLSDEATSALDPETTHQILTLLKELNEELNLTVLLITHEMEVVKTICHSAALMRKGNIVEQGKLVDVLAVHGSVLGNELFPLGPLPRSRGNTIIEVTFAGVATNEPFIAQLVRDHDIDASLLGAAIENIGDMQIGRTRLELPGPVELHQHALADLRSKGLIVDVISNREGNDG